MRANSKLEKKVKRRVEKLVNVVKQSKLKWPKIRRMRLQDSVEMKLALF
jgi:hypothetical protein